VSFVIKVSNYGTQHPQWIGPDTRIGPKRLVSREEARLFPTELDAVFEIKIFEHLFPAGVQFDLQSEAT
jgi:hypothetical protein